MYRGRHWVRNALGMMDRHNAIVTLQDETDIQPLFSISRAKERALGMMDSIGTTTRLGKTLCSSLKIHWTLDIPSRGGGGS